MKKVLFGFVLLSVVCLCSCTTLGSSDSLSGVWENRENGQVITYIFTSDGHYAYECWVDDNPEYADFGTYFKDETVIHSSSDDIDYQIGDKFIKLNDTIYTRKSRLAKYSSGLSRLRGVWKNDSNLLGFTSSYAVVMGENANLTSYLDNQDVISVAGREYETAVINGKLYVRDGEGFFSQNWGTVIFERQTSAGLDTTTREILVRVGTWTLVDTQGYTVSNYTFSENGSYLIVRTATKTGKVTQSSGTFKLTGNRISLSNDGDLDYAIVDSTPFMFTI